MVGDLLSFAGTTSSKKLHLKDTSLPTALAFRLNLASHATKKASKTPRKAVFSAISSPVRSHFGEKFAS